MFEFVSVRGASFELGISGFDYGGIGVLWFDKLTTLSSVEGAR
jgi:hypothetical protein